MSRFKRETTKSRAVKGAITVMWWGTNDWGWGWGIVMMFGMIAFWAFVVWALMAVARGSVGQRQVSPRDPESTLAERFAAGEIEEDEYRSRRDVLREASPRVRLGRRT
jgi:putative membrane protein